MSQSYDLLLCLSLSLYSINTGTIKNRHAHYHRIHRSAESSSWRGLSADFCKLNLNPHERTSAASRGLLDPRVRPFVPASRRLPRARTVNTPKLMFVEFKAACKQPHGAVLCYAIRCERRGKTGRFQNATTTGATHARFLRDLRWTNLRGAAHSQPALLGIGLRVPKIGLRTFSRPRRASHTHARKRGGPATVS